MLLLIPAGFGTLLHSVDIVLLFMYTRRRPYLRSRLWNVFWIIYLYYIIKNMAYSYCWQQISLYLNGKGQSSTRVWFAKCHYVSWIFQSLFENLTELFRLPTNDLWKYLLCICFSRIFHHTYDWYNSYQELFN